MKFITLTLLCISLFACGASVNRPLTPSEQKAQEDAQRRSLDRGLRENESPRFTR